MFYAPWMFSLLLIVPVIAWLLFRKSSKSAIAFSSISIIRELKPTLRQRLIWLPKALTLAALVVLIIAVARPREGKEQTIVDSEGIAIEMVVDRSGSMHAMDFHIEDQQVDRLTAIKNVAGKFISGDEGLDGRNSDLVGLITFAGFADSLTPPTLDHSFLVTNLNDTEIVSKRREDGTAIGDAIALAVEKLNALDDSQEEEVKSKVIILLTDGENTAGDLDPIPAAELAQTLGIKIYTIGVGTKGNAPYPVTDPFSGRTVMRMMSVNIDEATLKEISSITGGKYFRATDTDSLTKIYKEIDELEKTKVETDQYYDYRELAVLPLATSWGNIPPVLMIVISLIVLRVLLENTWLREMSDT